MRRRGTGPTLVLAAALLVGLGPYMVRAAGVRQAAAPAVANVDMAVLMTESDAGRAAAAHMRTFRATAADHYEATQRLKYLTTAEIEDYSRILNSAKPTDADQKRLDEVKAESERRAEEMRALQSKRDSELAAQDRARLRELAGIEQQRPLALDGLRGLYQALVSDEDARQTRSTAAQIRDAVNKLAREQGISQVFDTTSLVVAPVDLTQMALQRLKKK